MRVVVLAENARRCNAVGNHVAEIAMFFQDRSAELRVLVEDATLLHPSLRTVATAIPFTDDVPDFLCDCDLVIVIYAGAYRLLHWLPRLSGRGPRIVFDYLGVTPAELWAGTNRERLARDAAARGYVWFADHALTMSQASRRELAEATGFPESRTTTSPLCVDTSRFFPDASDRAAIRARLGLTGPTLLFVGRLARNKCVPMVIQALARLGPEYRALVVGDASDVYTVEAERCQSLATELGVADRIRFVGAVADSELPSYYRAADLFIMPSLHEGFCVPVIEAQASGLPVIAARATALPETVGAAGLTFTPNDVGDLVKQIRRAIALEPQRKHGSHFTKRIAVGCFRFGKEIIGGAETSLRAIVTRLSQAGHRVEVFATRTQSESRWTDDLPAGTTHEAGIIVHRFAIDRPANSPADSSLAAGERHLRDSIHSSELVNALKERANEFDAILIGPYLFGLTADIAQALPEKTLLVPCFHDEPLAHLSCWPSVYGDVAGILFHSEEELAFAQARLGINHPNSVVIGTVIDLESSARERALDSPISRPYIVYCGRYAEQKNLPMLLDWMAKFQNQHPGLLDLVLVGAGELAIPNEPWLRNLGRVDEATKRRVLRGSCALVQLSTLESLSIVALEAWAEATPVIAHRDCAVLRGQIERAAGGAIVADCDEFSQVLREFLDDLSQRHRLGENGKRYVAARYADAQPFVDRIVGAIDRIAIPIRQQLIDRGLEQARSYSRPSWQDRFADFVDHVLTQPARSADECLEIEPLRMQILVGANERTALAPMRVTNHGSRSAIGQGIGRTLLCCEVAEGEAAAPRQEQFVAEMLQPGQSTVLPLPIAVPDLAGEYRIRVWCEREGAAGRIRVANDAMVTLIVSASESSAGAAPAGTFLDVVRRTLPRTHQNCVLPSDYVDVTEGMLAPVKRFIKKKVLHNFKHGYVDAVSRQQSKVNSDLLLMVQQLSECCAMLDQAIVGLHRRIDAMEARFAPSNTDSPTMEVHG